MPFGTVLDPGYFEFFELLELPSLALNNNSPRRCDSSHYKYASKVSLRGECQLTELEPSKF